MTYRDYMHKSLSFMKTRRYVVDIEIVNDNGTIPIDTEVRVIRKDRGLTIKTLGCPHCKCSLGASRVNHYNVIDIGPIEVDAVNLPDLYNPN